MAVRHSRQTVIQISISVATSVISWAQIVLMGRTFETDNMSRFLAAWSIFGYIALSLFAAQDSITWDSEVQSNQIENARKKIANFNYGERFWAFSLGLLLLSLALAINQSKVATIILCVVAALSQFPAQKLVKNRGGASALNYFLLLISTIRFLALIPLLVVLQDDQQIISMIFFIIILANVLSWAFLDRGQREFSSMRLRIDSGILSKSLLFWGLFYSDAIFARYYMSSEEAAAYTVLSFLIKGMLITQILPIITVIDRVKNRKETKSTFVRMLREFFPFILISLIFSFIVLRCESQIFWFLLNREFMDGENYAWKALFYHLTFPFIFVFLEKKGRIGHKFTILTLTLTFLILIVGNYLAYSESFFFVTLGVVQAFVFLSLCPKIRGANQSKSFLRKLDCSK